MASGGDARPRRRARRRWAPRSSPRLRKWRSTTSTRGAPFVAFRHGGEARRLDRDWAAGCDGFHGVSRPSILAQVRREFEKVSPVDCLDALSRTQPIAEELIYASHMRGSALCSRRNPMLSCRSPRVPATKRAEDWSDEALWAELRLLTEVTQGLVTGLSIETSVALLRPFVNEPMRWGRLCLCGDVAHIVPPTGAKGLNLAVSDVRTLSVALGTHDLGGDDAGTEDHSATALARVWKAKRLSWSMTTMPHRFLEHSRLKRRMRDAGMGSLAGSEAARRVLAEA